jgi:phosphotransferase system HPr-like phosphotransfer protein
MLMVLALGAKHGEELEIVVGDDESATQVLATIAHIIATNHDEDNPKA